MSDLGSTTTPVDKPVENAEKVDEVKQNQGVAAKEQETTEKAEIMPNESKGKGKGKAVVEDNDDDDDDDDDDDEDEEESDDEDDEDDIAMDEVDLDAIVPPTSRRSARNKQIDYSSEEALKKAGLAANTGGESTTAADSLPADEEEDEDFKADDTMEDD